MDLIIGLVVGLLIGVIAGFLGWRAFRSLTLKRAQEEADEIIQEMKDQIEIEDLERQERTQEIETEAWTKVEPDMLKVEEHLEELQEKVDEKKAKHDLVYSQARQKLVEQDREVKAQEEKSREAEKAFDAKRARVRDLNGDFTKSLTAKLNTTPEEIKTQIVTKLEEDARERARKYIEAMDEDVKAEAETRAKNIIDIAIDRFMRPYCAERGIGQVNWPDANARKLFCDPEGLNAKAITEACGCDVIIEAESEIVGVAGFDPVRRELTRRTLERVLKEKKKIDPAFIKKIAENQKRELFGQIKRDGDNVAKELRLENLHPEIRQMMGSLRYRYSFTQNQHFHCAEVGWLCGLLAAEVGADLKRARRSGLLHDIGKAMDHASEGGHAVIGANFIQERNEDPEVVHNVRSHHFDEQPATDVAFLVIAADAISGGRPGARRSTVEAYSQKVEELTDIARGFPGVTDCYVLSGGREVRVFVNGKKIDDNRALEMSRDIAKQVEEKCSYPGQIKIVVVRETVASESTMANKAHA